MNRRTFLKIAGMGSISIAAGCSPESPSHLYAPTHAPEDMVPGRATWYATTCRECPAGCGVIAKNREGRVVKLEGNPAHPINAGRLCARGQAALQALYHPDRLRTPMLKTEAGWQPIGRGRALALLREKAAAAAAAGEGRVRLVTETVGDSLAALFAEVLERWRSPAPLVFEPFAYEALKAANRELLGVPGLVGYRLQEADVVVSFGAEFLETWLSPVEYARKFKAMHAPADGPRGLFFQVSPFRSLTGVNADHWLACRPGTEALVALGLVRQMLDINRGAHLPEAFRRALHRATADYGRPRVLEISGVALPPYERLVTRLAAARRPLVLGGPTGANDRNGLLANLAANLLNLMLDPELQLLDARNRHRVETAAPLAELRALLEALGEGQVDLLLLNNVNPVFALPAAFGAAEALAARRAFVVSFASFMDESAEMADLVLPTAMWLESWDDYGGWQSIVSTLQPAMAPLHGAPQIGDVLLAAAFGERPPQPDYKRYLVARLAERRGIGSPQQWVRTLQQGGDYAPRDDGTRPETRPGRLPPALAEPPQPPAEGLVLAAAPSIRYFDGRGANRPWLNEIPDPLSRVAWQTPVLMHPDTARGHGLAEGDVAALETSGGRLEAAVYPTALVVPGAAVVGIGQGHRGYGRWAAGRGVNPLAVMAAGIEPATGGLAAAATAAIAATGRRLKLARMYGSRTQHGRPFALSVAASELAAGKPPHRAGLTMGDFPLTLPLEEGYDPARDFYPPHAHDTYRWAMVVDLDRCIGCNACTAACYAENNIGVVGEKGVIDGREMVWLGVERYFADDDPRRVTFLPLMCQHCDNAPCESVCPVYAPHHSKEGLNNQIYNRCIGTRFCAQNCPYKVRRFNWFTWQWPEPLNLQLNPDVTVRSKGVMEKCSFCVQRIKEAHTNAKNEKRPIRDGEVTPACVQTCPTEALVFGNLMDTASRVRRLCADPRAYQVMGYLNTKPAVIYLKKILRDV